MHPILFQLGPFQIRMYGILLSAAFLIGVRLAGRRGAARGIAPATIHDLAIVIIVSAIIGARGFYILTHRAEYAADPLSMLKVWEGGLSMYGGVLLAIASSALFARSKSLPFGRIADVVAPSLAIGAALTRVGCYFNGCCFGRPTSSAFGTLFPPRSEAGFVFFGERIHPTQLYASFYSLVIFLVLLGVDRRIRGGGVVRDGFLFGLFLMLQGAARFTVDFYRYYAPGSTFPLFGVLFNYNQVVSLFLFLFGLTLIARSVRPAGERVAGLGEG
jgi:phosphatidylglycerol:prolipoprotein diacylglycerol transferase